MSEVISKNESDATAALALSLGAVEAGLGSVVHTLHLPLGGHLLSLNQGFFLGRFVRSHRENNFSRRLPWQGSVGAALLKSFSPAGKKLTPMLAISVQGFLFSCGTLFFGTNPFGVAVGFAFLSLWAFVQQPLLMWLMFGNDLIRGFEKLAGSLADTLGIATTQLLSIVMACVLVKIAVSAVLTVLVFKMPDRLFARYQNWLVLRIRGKHPLQNAMQQQQSHSLAGSAKLALKDVFNVWFFVSLMLTVVFVIFSESSFVHALWIVFRAIAIGFLMFFAVRVFPLERLLKRGENARFGALLKKLRAGVSVSAKDESHVDQSK